MTKYAKYAIIALVFLVGVNGCSTYNDFVDKDQDVANAFGGMQTSYQRRNDLIPNIVAVVKGAANYEKTTLTEVITARANATKTVVQLSPGETLTKEKLQAFNKSQSELSGALSRLLVTVEKYPDLKVNQNFLRLQSQLEGTENRIKVARDDFNQKVNAYNVSVLHFPRKIWASLFGFKSKDYFQSTTGADQAPDIEL